MKTAYYNEIDPYCVDWLKNLINAGLIPNGEVDSRSIVDVRADDLRGFGQKHFFAGIGGWALACRLAGYPDDADIVTGSPPCQPFSVAGRLAGTADDRHLWPEMARLVASLRPAAAAVENVANVVGMALDGMLSDLAGCGYAARAFVVPACAVDAPHRRDRVWIAARSMVNAAGVGRGEGRAEHELRGGRATAAGSGVSHGVVADTNGAVPERGARAGAVPGEAKGGRAPGQPYGPGDRLPWDGAEYREGADGKARRVEPGVRLLAHGVPCRVAKLRAFGNAIVPQVAAEVLKAMVEQRA